MKSRLKKFWKAITWPVRKAWVSLMHWVGDNVFRMVLVIIFFLVCIPFSVFNVVILDNINEAQRSGCVRNQPTKVGLFDFLEGAREARLSSAKRELKVDPEQAKIDFAAAKDYKTIQDTLILANIEFAIASDEAEISCEDAYPRPWPLSLFS